MIRTRFHQVRLVVLTYKATVDGKPELVPKVLPYAAHQIDAGIRVLNEIERDHLGDVAAHADWLGAWGADGRRDLDRWSEFQARQIGRIGAYIVFSATLRRVVVAAYKSAAEHLRACDGRVASVVEMAHASRIKASDDAFADLKLLRDKVFAHTAWSDPKVDGKPEKMDSLSRQMTSLVYLVGEGGNPRPDGLLMGGMAISMDDGPSEFLPATSVNRAAETVAAQMAEWRSLLDEVMSKITALPDETIKRGIPNVVKVERPAPSPA